MNVISRVLQFCLLGCQHEHTIRERRLRHGVNVLHFVCESCGYAVPAIDRTAEEDRQIVEKGAIKPLRLQHVQSGVVDLRARRRAS
jgi:hypothetical protein